MNRAQRRAAARGSAQQPTVKQIPQHIDEHLVFQGILHFFDRLEEGYLEEGDGMLLIRNTADEYSDVVSELNNWISVWKQYDQQFNLNHDMSALVRLANCLNYRMLIKQSLVQSAREVVNEQRRLFKRIDRKQIASIARTQSIRTIMAGGAA